MMDTKKKTITYLDVCLDPLSKICLNTEAKEHSQQKSRILFLAKKFSNLKQVFHHILCFTLTLTSR